MEKLNSPAELLQPDPRNLAIVKMSPQGEIIPTSVEDFYGWAEFVKVSDHVPEDVCSYVETIRNLFVFGWYHYPLSTLAAFLATTAVEMALRKRYPQQEPDHRKFSALLRRAQKDGLLADDRFPTLMQRRAEAAAMMDEGPIRAVPVPYAEIVCSSIPSLRNTFAHPAGHWIMPPGPALDMLITCVEVVNAIFTGVREQTNGQQATDFPQPGAL